MKQINLFVPSCTSLNIIKLISIKKKIENIPQEKVYMQASEIYILIFIKNKYILPYCGHKKGNFDILYKCGRSDISTNTCPEDE
jgi:glutaredoxin-related protein